MMSAGPPPDQHCQELASIMNGMYDGHLQNRADIDEVVRRLVETEGRLEGVIGGEADGRAMLICRKRQADLAAEDIDRTVGTCETELQELLAERDAKTREEEELLKELAALEQQRERGEHGSLSAETADIMSRMAEIDERERYLRLLEQRAMHKDQLEDEGRKAVEALLREQEDLMRMHGQFYQTAEATLEGYRQNAEDLERRYGEAQAQREELAAQVRDMRAQRDGERTHLEALQQVHAALEDDLERSRLAAAEAEAELARYLEHLNSGVDPEWELMKLEEVMMLLKAAAISLSTDHAFIGEVLEKVTEMGEETEERGLQSFCDAYRYIRTRVEALQGTQPLGQRWRAPDGEQWHPVPYELVEPLLSALKQLVICFDMMFDAAKRSIPFARELIRNSAHLLDLLQETGLKYREIERAREEEAQAVLLEEEERKRLRDAKKYAPRPNRPPYTVRKVAPARPPQQRGPSATGSRSGSGARPSGGRPPAPAAPPQAAAPATPADAAAAAAAAAATELAAAAEAAAEPHAPEGVQPELTVTPSSPAVPPPAPAESGGAFQ
eukprot:TRINITY_DN51157_c0_g1_i1.p1 TRINITY_DN51157_c0_g1~~TRINITY_DN51157_c0_g1_i1.p1  ORF type:complete len:557 (+),score=221.36 TRINITY_DN51157_c0_g1_i1:100-1770(+)